MQKNKLTRLILDSERKIFAIVGPNASGKSYYLKNDLFSELSNDILILDEEGRFYTKDNRKRVKLSEEYYIYDNEFSRGIDNRDIQVEKINNNSLKIVNEIMIYKNEINNGKKSLGNKKLLNILEAFLSYNLNQIKYFLFDEPENSLDDKRIRIIGKIFKLMIDNNKKIIFITHSPRLLELLQIGIENIYLFPRIYSDVVNVSFEEILDIYNKNGKKLNELNHNSPNRAHENYDFLPGTGVANLYLNEFLKSSDFYRALFYSHIVLVEGNTEELLAKELSDELELARCIVNSHGKYRMPFLFKVFSIFCEKITCIIDSDYKNGNISFSTELTSYIESFKKQNEYFVYTLPNDLESFLKVENEEIVLELTGIELASKNFIEKFARRYKPYLTLHTIKNNFESREKIKKLFNNSSDSFEF